MKQEKLDRISELTRIARERELTESEISERMVLRQEYIAEWRRGTLEVWTICTLLQGTEKSIRSRKRKEAEAAEKSANTRGRSSFSPGKFSKNPFLR